MRNWDKHEERNWDKYEEGKGAVGMVKPDNQREGEKYKGLETWKRIVVCLRGRWRAPG